MIIIRSNNLITPFYKMFWIGLAKSIIKDNKQYPKRVWILGIVILLVWFIFLIRYLFSLWGIWGSIWMAILIMAAIITFISIED